MKTRYKLQKRETEGNALVLPPLLPPRRSEFTSSFRGFGARVAYPRPAININKICRLSDPKKERVLWRFALSPSDLLQIFSNIPYGGPLAPFVHEVIWKSLAKDVGIFTLLGIYAIGMIST